MDVFVIGKATRDQDLKAIFAASDMTNVKYVVQDQDFKLNDGKIVAKYSVMTADYPGAKLRTYMIGMEKGDKVILISIATVDGGEDEALFKDIFNTVVLK